MAADSRVSSNYVRGKLLLGCKHVNSTKHPCPLDQCSGSRIGCEKEPLWDLVSGVIGNVGTSAHCSVPTVFNNGPIARSNSSSVSAFGFTSRKSAQCSACSTVCPGCTSVIGPSVSISKNSLFVNVSNEHPKSGYVFSGSAFVCFRNASLFSR